MDSSDFIIIDDELFEYVHKFGSDGEIDMDTKNMIENTKDNNFISYFDLKKFICDNKQSYGDKLEKIYGQFERDFSRQTIILNGHTYSEQTNFINQLDLLLNNKIEYVPFYMRIIFPYNNINCGEIFDVSYRDLIILLCCQSSFYLPFQILRNVYNSENNGIILVSSSGKKDTILTNIVINKKTLNIELNTILLIKNIEKNIMVKKLYVTLFVNIDFDENQYNDSHIVVFTWNIRTV
jgi:hypothetical protein